MTISITWPFHLFCQDPTNPGVIYFSTGEAASNADAHFGAGVWKSTDKGETWQQLPSTLNFIRNWKIICDAAGNIYLASRTTATPALNTTGLARSTDGGTPGQILLQLPQGTATASATCTDVEYTSTGKLVATFRYATGGTTLVEYIQPAPFYSNTGFRMDISNRHSGRRVSCRSL